MARPANADRFERDAKLMTRLSQGDVSALSSLMRLYGVWLTESAYGIVNSIDMAQDVVQDVFTRLWDTRDRLQVQTSVAAFLYRSVANRALDAVKHERVHRSIAHTLAVEAAALQSVSENAGIRAIAREEAREAINAALEQLAPRAKDIFLMRVEQGMDYQEIADACGITVSTAYKQVYLATKQLAQIMGGWDGEIF